MPTLSQIAARTKTTSVPWGDIAFNVTYRPGNLTGNLIAEIQQNGDLETISRAMIDDLLVSWDLTEDDGVTMFPLDQSRFGEIGLPVLMAIFGAMVSDLRPEVGAPRNAQNGAN